MYRTDINLGAIIMQMAKAIKLWDHEENDIEEIQKNKF